MGKRPSKLKSLLNWHGEAYVWNMDQPIDITREIDPIGGRYTRCFYAPSPEAYPLSYGDTTLSTAQGAPVNSYNLQINIHGTGTHTETVRHISSEGPMLISAMKQFLHVAQLIIITPERIEEDLVVTRALLEAAQIDASIVSLVVKTTKTDQVGEVHDFSGTNPPYFHPDAIAYLVDLGIAHLVVDLPSVDREEDGGKVLSHKTFWAKSVSTHRENCTITELVFIPESLDPGLYLLSISPVKLNLDAAMSRVILYQLHRHDSISQ